MTLMCHSAPAMCGVPESAGQGEAPHPTRLLEPWLPRPNNGKHRVGVPFLPVYFLKFFRLQDGVGKSGFAPVHRWQEPLHSYCTRK